MLLRESPYPKELQNDVQSSGKISLMPGTLGSHKEVQHQPVKG